MFAIRTLALIFMLPLLALAQFYGGSKYSGIGIPYFEAESFRTFAPGDKDARVYIFNEIINDDLTFIQEGNSGYKAQFELVMAFFDENEEQVLSRTIRREITETDFVKTNSRDKKTILTNYYDLNAGKYVLKMQMLDITSGKSTNRQMDVLVEKLNREESAISDLLFLQDVQVDSSGMPVSMVPRVRTNFQGHEGIFFIHFDVHTNQVPVEAKIRYRLQSGVNSVEVDSSSTEMLNEQVSSFDIRLDKSKLTRNEYTCIVEVEINGEEVEKRKTFSFFWVDSPDTQDDLNQAFEQMVYILPDDSLDLYEEASLEKQQEFFKRFWAQKDPNPNTEVNELMEEYFRRINYANREFSSFSQDGWRSDRGRILVKFGFPDDVERHPFEIDSVPYEIWRYYALRKVFVFADKTGFGDYRLLPQYMDEEYH
jgi:GWxTD domain-containing protein